MVLPKHIHSPDPAIYFSPNFVVIDFETTSLGDKGDANNQDNHIVLTCYSQGEKIKYSSGNELQIGHIVDKCEQADFIVIQNAKFDLQWLKRAGADLTKIVVFDTMIADYVIAGNRPWRLSLNAIAARYGLGQKDNFVNGLIKGGVCPSEIPFNFLLKYCAKDVELTKELFKRQLAYLHTHGLLNVFYTRCLFTPALADIEGNGIHLDEELVRQEYVRVINEYQEIIAKLDKLTGGINPNSSDQVAEFLYQTLKFEELKDRRGNAKRNKASKRWPEGKPKTDSETVLSLKAKTKKQREFVELKKKQSVLNAELTKALKKFYDCVEAGDTLYASLNQTTTQTHRLSSTGKSPYNAQFQNIKRTHKKFITARSKEWEIIEADYASLEFNGAAFLSQDRQAKDDVINKFDVHRYSASVMNNKPMEEITKDERTAAKKDTFKPLYYGRSGTPEQMAYYEAFRLKYPKINSMQEEWISTVLSTGKLTTATGLVFYWPDTKMTRSGWVTNSNNICNYPVQNISTCEVSSIGTLYLWHRMKVKEMKSFLINAVHDSVWVETHPEEKQEIMELLQQSLVEDVYEYFDKVYGLDYNIPITIEIEGGKSLGK